MPVLSTSGAATGPASEKPAPETSASTGAAPAPAISMRVFFRVARGYWRGPSARQAWLITAGIVTFTIGNMIAGLSVNQWNRFFFDALEAKNVRSVEIGVMIILGLAFFAAASSVALVQFRLRLQVRWRQWLTRHLMGVWLADRRYYQLNIVDPENNPEGRMADDVRLSIEPLVDFSIGLVNALLVSVTFLSILWIVGGGITFPLNGAALTIPGYMVWVAVCYSALATFATLVVGRPLIRYVERKNSGEADFRYELTRVRESAENIALIGGDEEERAHLDERLSTLVLRWLSVVRQQARLTWILNSNAVLVPVVALIFGAPKYLAGELSLGQLMQAAAAFVQVQVALNWFVDNAIRLAEWSASSQRVSALLLSLDGLDDKIRNRADGMILLEDSPDDHLRIEKLSLFQQNGTMMIEGADADIAPGEKVLVKGGSGTGKSTLIRAIAGLWPWGTGRILRPKGVRVAFVPQRPYIPRGTLRAAVLYPEVQRAIADEKLAAALGQCGLTHLAPRLAEEDQWDKILSGGEQQRLAFARLIIDPPEIIILDEATSALDELSQAHMLEFFRTDLAKAMVLNVAHRPGLEAYHSREIHLVRVEGEVTAHAEHQRNSPWLNFWRRVAGQTQ